MHTLHASLASFRVHVLMQYYTRISIPDRPGTQRFALALALHAGASWHGRVYAHVYVAWIHQ